MKREGRQHGWVRTRMILKPSDDQRPSRRYVNVLDALPSAGVFAKVPSKPTNHSKFTGRCTKQACAECRHCPACKSIRKTKGASKLQRPMDGVPRGLLDHHVISAAEIIRQLTGEDADGEDAKEEEADAAAGPAGHCMTNAEEQHQQWLDDDDEPTEGEWLVV